MTTEPSSSKLLFKSLAFANGVLFFIVTNKKCKSKDRLFDNGLNVMRGTIYAPKVFDVCECFFFSVHHNFRLTQKRDIRNVSMLYFASSCCLRKYNKIKLIAFAIIRLHLKNSVRRYRFFLLKVAFGHAFDNNFDINIFPHLLHFDFINCNSMKSENFREMLS